MRTHSDGDSRRASFMESLQKRAKEAIDKGDGKITAGITGEEIVCRWSHGGIEVVQRPDDPQGILRISIGGGVDIVPLDYCTIRGDVGKCIAILERAINALRNSPE